MVDVATIYRQHGPMVLRRARHLLADEEAGRDIVHDVFLTLYEQRHSFIDRGIVSWLYVVTTNRCLKLLRQRQTHNRLQGRVPAIPAENGQSQLENAAMVRGILDELPDELAAVAFYRFVDGMTHAEVAEVIGCSRRHVGDLLARFDVLAEKAWRTV